jgi:hypothetical protein
MALKPRIATTLIKKGFDLVHRFLPMIFPMSHHRRAIGRPARPVGRAQLLRDDPLKAHATSVHEEQGAILVGLVTEDDADPPSAQQPRQPLLAVSQRQ